MNSGTAAPICQKTINRVIPSYNLSFANLYLSTASDKCLRYATFNKPCFSIYCSLFVGTLLKTTELARRQPIDILKVRVITLIQTVQVISINDMNDLLIV